MSINLTYLNLFNRKTNLLVSDGATKTKRLFTEYKKCDVVLLVSKVINVYLKSCFLKSDKTKVNTLFICWHSVGFLGIQSGKSCKRFIWTSSRFRWLERCFQARVKATLRTSTLYQYISRKNVSVCSRLLSFGPPDRTLAHVDEQNSW